MALRDKNLGPIQRGGLLDSALNKHATISNNTLITDQARELLKKQCPAGTSLPGLLDPPESSLESSGRSCQNVPTSRTQHNTPQSPVPQPGETNIAGPQFPGQPPIKDITAFDDRHRMIVEAMAYYQTLQPAPQAPAQPEPSQQVQRARVPVQSFPVLNLSKYDFLNPLIYKLWKTELEKYQNGTQSSDDYIFNELING